jgi:uncharacterized protein (DUF488 family)
MVAQELPGLESFIMTTEKTSPEGATLSASTVLTIGHGRHAFDYFLSLLQRHGVQMVCDVRSAARSRWPQFNGRVLEELLGENGIGYEWLPECGGKVLAPPADFARGLDRIAELAGEMRVCLMCSESQPLTQHRSPRANCHRVGMLATPLRQRGLQLLHILPGGPAVEIDETSVDSIW